MKSERIRKEFGFEKRSFLLVVKERLYENKYDYEKRRKKNQTHIEQRFL